MFFLYYLTDLILLSFIPTIGLYINTFAKTNTSTNSPALEIIGEARGTVPAYDWSLSESEIAKLNKQNDSQILSPNADNNLLLNLLLIAGLLLPALLVLKVNILAYITASLITIYLYNTKNFLETLKQIKLEIPNISKNRIIENFTSLQTNLKSESQLKLFYTILTFDFICLDLIIAKLSLDKISAAIYIILSVMVKILIVAGIWGLHKWLIEKNIFNDKFVDKRVMTIFFFISLPVFYLFFIASKFFTKILTLNAFTNFHSALPYILATHILMTSIFSILYFNRNDLIERKELHNFLLHFTLTLHVAIALMVLFFYISSLEAVTFFVSGISLFLLTLFYHLIYRLHIYSQLV